MVEISTSILNVEKENAMKVFYGLEIAHTDYFHIDVMDGKFVPKNTVDLMREYSNSIKQMSNIPLDVHLMVEDIKKYVDEYMGLKPNIITFHIEVTKTTEETIKYINYIKSNNMKCGISVKPNTKIEEIYEYLPYVHTCLVMTVEPGLGGQKLIPETLNKVRKLKEYVDQNSLDIDIEVDGGINEQTADSAKQAGANIFVVGTAIVGKENIEEAVKSFRK